MSARLLIVTCANDEHVTEAEPILEELGIGYLRLNTELFPSEVMITLGDDLVIIKTPELELASTGVGWVWFRKPEVPEIPPEVTGEGHRNLALQESQTALEWLYQSLSHAKWMNNPSSNRAASPKMLQLRVARSLGMETPRSIVSNDAEEIEGFVSRLGGSGIAIKTMGPHAYHDKSSIYGLYTKRLDPDELLENLDSARVCPSFIQQYVEKRLELRITVEEDEVFACEIHSQEQQETSQDWRHPKFVYEIPHKPHKLTDRVREQCLAMMRHFGLRFGAFDFILTPDGRYVFLEVNANGQWLWLEDLTDLKITRRVVQTFTC